MRPLLVFLLASAVASDASACVTTLGSYQPPTGVGRTQIVMHDFPSWGGLVADRAMNDWNRSSCNGSGTDFPYLQTEAAGTQNTLHVFWNPGTAPPGLGPRACAAFSLETSFINLYATTKDEKGVVYSCGDPYGLADNLAHEIGHYLGLGDAPAYCGPSLIMARPVFDSSGNLVLRDPVAAECGRADDLNETPTEQITSPPDDPYCDAYCWTSCQGGVCPTRPPNYEGCPVLLDLDGDGFHLTGLENPVWFDIDADGSLENMSWTDGGDAFLVLDRNENLLIDDGSELFGNHTLLADGRKAPNGFEALAELDLVDYSGNANGRIDPGDWVYSYLRVWSDANHNGISESNELQTLAEAGVLEVSWQYRRAQRRDRHGNEFRFKSKARIIKPGGREHATPTWDVFFVIQR